ncbi:MAG: response regulator [Candidatus Omnitrophota bacterium]
MEKGKILVIDENKKDADWVSGILQNEGYSITCVYSGKEGLRKAEEERYSLVILDLELTDIKGEEVRSLLKKKKCYKKVPVLILSVKNDIEDIEGSLQRGADDYIIKPPRSEHLLNKIEKYASV